MLSFNEWLETVSESFVSYAAQPGDMVYFGVHDIDSIGPDMKPDANMVNKMSVIKGIRNNGKVQVTVPAGSRYRGLNKSSEMFIPQDKLKDISHHLSAFAANDINANGQPRKLFLYVDKPYHERLVTKKDRAMVQQMQQPKTLSMTPNVTQQQVAAASNWLRNAPPAVGESKKYEYYAG